MAYDKIPDFPFVSNLSENDKKMIAVAAWKQSNGSTLAFQQLIAEHIAGTRILLPPAAPVDPGPPAPIGPPLSGAEITRLAELRAITDPLTLAEIAELEALAAREE